MKAEFRDIGRVANAQEARTCAMVRGSDGSFHLVICSQGFVVSVNLNTAVSTFHPFPDNYKAYPYGSMGSRNGKVYFGAGKMFYEFDPAVGSYTFYEDVNKTDAEFTCEAWAPSEAEDGKIYFGACPVPHLTSFDPVTREFVEYGVMSDEQEYLENQAVDSEGWIYCGMGYACPEIIALNLETREKRSVIKGGIRGKSGKVRLGMDGQVYGTVHEAREEDGERIWYRLYRGELCERAEGPIKTYYTGESFDTMHCPFEEHPEIIEQDLVGHTLTYIHPTMGREVTVGLEYQCDGAEVSPITLGADGKIYGTTNHPMQLFTYDPKTDELINHGCRSFSKSIDGWGNICTYARHGNILGGAAYCGGYIVRIDVTQPISNEKDDVNPHCEGEFSEILRPRSAAAVPDGKTMVFGGFNVYGKPGGGLVVYDSAARTCRVIENERLRPGHSVLAIAPLSETRILCGTSTEVPAGKATAVQAEIFEYDIADERMIYAAAPIPGTKCIEHLKRDSAGRVHGITGEGVYFMYDAEVREVVHTQDLSEYGTPVRDGMCILPDGTLYGLLTDGIYRTAPGGERAEIIARPPCEIKTGMAVADGKIYFGDCTHLWEYTI